MAEAQSTVTSGSPRAVAATIASGASLSGAVLCDGRLAGIITDTAWTAAAITFSVSADGTTYYDLWSGGEGTAAEATIASGNISTSAAKFISLTFANWVGIKYVKIRSGTSASPVNQGSARSLSLVLAG